MYQYYLYRHIREDIDLPFYIGIGKVRNRPINSHTHNYDRAYSKRNRNPIWKNIVAKTTYKIEIVFKSDCRDEICEKEKEFIKLYRLRQNNGLLCNLTEGGEGILGYAFTKEQKEHMSLIQKEIANRPEKIEFRRNICIGNSYMKGKKHSEISKKIMSEKAKIRPLNSKHYMCRLIDLETKQIWESHSLMSLAKIAPISISTIDRMSQNKKISDKFRLKYKLEILNDI